MDALDALQHRFSVPRLVAPGPSEAQREHLFRAALRAPDHGLLRPWRFLTIEGAAREALGELYAKAMAANTSAVSEQALDKARAMPLRAPLLVVVIACVRAHPKVPAQEQVLSAACAAHAILLAAHAQGIGAVWRTGELCYDPLVNAGLGLSKTEQVVGYLYLGTAQREPHQATELAVADYVRMWSGQAEEER
jgi:nitroreductase